MTQKRHVIMVGVYSLFQLPSSFHLIKKFKENKNIESHRKTNVIWRLV